MRFERQFCQRIVGKVSICKGKESVGWVRDTRVPPSSGLGHNFLCYLHCDYFATRELSMKRGQAWSRESRGCVAQLVAEHMTSSSEHYHHAAGSQMMKPLPTGLLITCNETCKSLRTSSLLILEAKTLTCLCLVQTWDKGLGYMFYRPK